MTPERQKWWDSLPANEKELRESLKIHRNLLSFNKAELTNNKDSAYISKFVRREKVLIKAIRHELERGNGAKVKRNAEGELYCDNCCHFIQRYDNYCANYCTVCGKKLRWDEYYGK